MPTKNPIIKKSYGIILATYNTKSKKVEFLLVKKRSTYEYIDLLLKYHNKHDESQILYNLNHTTMDEKIDLATLDFGRMWFRVWLINPDSPYTPNHLKLSDERYEKYKICKHNFERTFAHDQGRLLRDLISKSKSIETLWEIPKGRRSYPQEKELVCAMREFREETGISSDNYYVLNNVPIESSIHAINVKYVNYYYIAILTNPNLRMKNPKLDFGNIQQISEVSDISWMDLDHISMIEKSGKIWRLLQGVNKVLRKKYKIAKLHELDLINGEF